MKKAAAKAGPAADPVAQAIEAWRINQRVNLRLIEAVSDEGLRCTLSKRGGRSVARQFAHLHNVRIWHLEARGKALAGGAHLFATDDEPDRKTLVRSLEDSARRVEEHFRRASAGEKGFRLMKRGLAAHLAYFVAHEAHHRGNILLTLKQCGHGVDKDTRYGIWDWERI